MNIVYSSGMSTGVETDRRELERMRLKPIKPSPADLGTVQLSCGELTKRQTVRRTLLSRLSYRVYIVLWCCIVCVFAPRVWLRGVVRITSYEMREFYGKEREFDSKIWREMGMKPSSIRAVFYLRSCDLSLPVYQLFPFVLVFCIDIVYFVFGCVSLALLICVEYE